MAGRDHFIDRFLDALAVEVLQLSVPTPRLSHPLATLFLGGGTPSHLSSAQLSRLAQILKTRFHWDSTTEVTAECNPNDITPEKLEALMQLGVNRISLGAQSLNRNKLVQLERTHRPEDVVQAVKLSKSYVDSVSLDLIFAGPNETLTDWQADLEQALETEPDHISTYELTFEKGTQFWNRLQRNQLSISDEDLRAEMYELAMQRLSQVGYDHYELSSFARQGHRCRHNQTYWSGQPYLAMGPGASSFVDGVRATNHAGPLQYMKRLESGLSPVDQTEQLKGLEAARERLVVGLRMLDGVLVSQLERETGFSLDQILGKAKTMLRQHDWLEIKPWGNDHRCALSPQGVLLSDGVASLILNG